jgi:hypothetical protein
MLPLPSTFSFSIMPLMECSRVQTWITEEVLTEDATNTLRPIALPHYEARSASSLIPLLPGAMT